jgi:hypothetical protein
MPYASCPKCNHAPLPEDQTFPAACPACGLILAKYRAPGMPAGDSRLPMETGAPHDRAPFAVTDQPDRGWLRGTFLHVPERVSRVFWQARLATLVVFTLWTVFIWRDMDVPGGESGSWFLHAVLTPFHEAGHYAIFRWFGNFIMTLGGTLGQHLLPIVIGVHFLFWQRNPFGAALALWLLGYSLSDMGVYMFDAFDPRLPLLDGSTGAESDGHDWQNIFGDLGLLGRARGIGVFWGRTGKLVMLAGLAWGAWMLWLQRRRLHDSPFAEREPG